MIVLKYSIDIALLWYFSIILPDTFLFNIISLFFKISAIDEILTCVLHLYKQWKIDRPKKWRFSFIQIVTIVMIIFFQITGYVNFIEKNYLLFTVYIIFSSISMYVFLFKYI